MSDTMWAIVIILGLIAISLFGGTKNAQHNNFVSNQSTQTYQTTSQNQLNQNQSVYTNQISFFSGQESNNPNQEYVEIDANTQNTGPIDITNWKLTDSGSNLSVLIPQSVGLYFANGQNYKEDVVLAPGEKAYIITGRSPIGYGLHANICSGYLSQFNSFTPYLYSSCPTALDESSSTVRHNLANNTCLDLIEQTPMCTTRTVALDNTYTTECQQLFSQTLNYQGCVDKHRHDANFYSPQKWYVYLNRDLPVWNARRDSVTLSDTDEKIIGTVSHY